MVKNGSVVTSLPLPPEEKQAVEEEEERKMAERRRRRRKVTRGAISIRGGMKMGKGAVHTRAEGEKEQRRRRRRCT